MKPLIQLTKQKKQALGSLGVSALTLWVLSTFISPHYGKATAEPVKSALAVVPIQIPEPRADGVIYLPGPDGRERQTTLNPTMQSQLNRYLADNQMPIAGLIVTDVRTGNVLALVQGRDPSTWGGKTHTALHRMFPAASVFKTVVTSAAFEVADMDATEPLGLAGGCGRVRESGEWLTDRVQDRPSDMSLRRAFGLSCNGFFAKIALSRLGLGPIAQMARKLGWETGITSDFTVDKSPFMPPTPQMASAHSIGSFAAGFGMVGLSPAHAAWIMQAIANGGIAKPLRLFRDTPLPDVTTADVDGGKNLQGDRVMSADTAHKLVEIMDASVRGGTASFAYRRGKYRKLRDLVGGKTGTLTGTSPKGLTTWFAGLAPLDNPEIAVAAVVILEDHWRVKGPLLAAEGIYQYFEQKTAQTSANPTAVPAVKKMTAVQSPLPSPSPR